MRILHATSETLHLNQHHELPGYALHGLQERTNGLTAQLTLAGPACNAFGHDVANLTLDVTYDSTTRQVYITSKCHNLRGC